VCTVCICSFVCVLMRVCPCVSFSELLLLLNKIPLLPCLTVDSSANQTLLSWISAQVLVVILPYYLFCLPSASLLPTVISIIIIIIALALAFNPRDLYYWGLKKIILMKIIIKIILLIIIISPMGLRHRLCYVAS